MKTVALNCKNITILLFLLHFWSNKYSLGEHQRLLWFNYSCNYSKPLTIYKYRKSSISHWATEHEVNRKIHHPVINCGVTWKCFYFSEYICSAWRKFIWIFPFCFSLLFTAWTGYASAHFSGLCTYLQEKILSFNVQSAMISPDLKQLTIFPPSLEKRFWKSCFPLWR